MEPVPFNMAKLPLLSGETLTQLSRLAGLTGEVISAISENLHFFSHY